MPCDPNAITVSPPPDGGPSFPGFSGFAPSFPAIPGLTLPDLPQDLLDLINKIALLLPGGKLQSNLNPHIDTTFLSVIIKLLDYLSVFLAFYKFILPILNIILCILEVLCALANPFKLIQKIRRLFRVCIPDFLALFPFLALIVMIISLILLIIALIEYIIAQILRIINALLKNIQLLSKIIKRRDARGALIAVRKIGALLCFLQNIFAVLAIIAALIQVIKDILKLSFKIPPCDDSGSDGDGCCTPDVCPQFIRAGDFTNNTGTLQYVNQIGIDASGITGIPPLLIPALTGLSAVRQESWQLYDSTLNTAHAFYNITVPYDVDPALGFTFFPQGKSYDQNTVTRKAPYTANIRLFYTPATFGQIDPLGPRFIRINNCVVIKTPPLSPIGWDNSPVAGIHNGSLFLAGGQAFEDNGTTKLMFHSVQGSLNSLIHRAPTSSSTGTLVNNAVLFSNITYTFHIGFETLVQEELITVGCVPDINLDKAVVNTAFGANNAAVSLALNTLTLPDAAAAQACLQTAMTTFRSNISLTSINTFQSDTTACLNKLLNDSKSALGALVDAGVSVNKSTFVINPPVQFSTQTILVTTTLNDGNGLNLCTKIPTDSAALLAAKIQPIITFGRITPFAYDGYGIFTAQISAPSAGSGTLRMKYNNNFFNTVTISPNLTIPASIVVTTLPYQFVSTPPVSGDGQSRHDEGDVARDIIRE